MAQMIEVIPRRESSAPTLIRRWLNAIWQTLSPVLMGMLILAGLWQVAA